MSKQITGFKPGSKKWKGTMAFVYGWGGALVIIGAMFKIQHWPGASVVLIGGLGVEAVIFILSAFEPLHEEVDWTLAYPELAVPDEEDVFAEDSHDAIEEAAPATDGSITEQLDSMLEEAKIEPELIASLGDGLRGLKDQTEKLGDITSASVATNEYAESLMSASKNVSTLSDTYSQASESLASLSSSNDAAAGMGEQFEKLTTNLTSLNSVYAAQLQSSEANSEVAGNFYNGITELVNNLNDSVESTRAYKENISELSKNLSSLNTVYGNMLNAMSVNRGE
ncbi:gliding motility protein GldL [Flavobacteriales bacterium]|nr:gliding motility protein GldL [Flavobacteriales bacterium]